MHRGEWQVRGGRIVKKSSGYKNGRDGEKKALEENKV